MKTSIDIIVNIDRPEPPIHYVKTMASQYLADKILNKLLTDPSCKSMSFVEFDREHIVYEVHVFTPDELLDFIRKIEYSYGTRNPVVIPG